MHGERCKSFGIINTIEARKIYEDMRKTFVKNGGRIVGIPVDILD